MEGDAQMTRPNVPPVVGPNDKLGPEWDEAVKRSSELIDEHRRKFLPPNGAGSKPAPARPRRARPKS